MTILVTGATGFVGAAVVRRLVAKGHAVRALVRARSDRQNLDSLPVDVVTGDLTDAESLARALAGCEGLFHVAAEYQLWVRDPATMYRVNVDGTRALLEAAGRAGVTRIVYTSSVATLGTRSDGRPADEDDPVRARRHDRPLQAIEVSGRRGRSRHGDVRCTGRDRESVDSDRTGGYEAHADRQFHRRRASGRMPAYVDTGLNVVHVDDVAEGHVLAFERGAIGRRYVLGGTDMTLQQILMECAASRVARQTPSATSPWSDASGCVCCGGVGPGERPTASRDRGWRATVAEASCIYSSARAQQELGYGRGTPAGLRMLRPVARRMASPFSVRTPVATALAVRGLATGKLGGVMRLSAGMAPVHCRRTR